MFRNIDRFLIGAVVLLALGQVYLFVGFWGEGGSAVSGTNGLANTGSPAIPATTSLSGEVVDLSANALTVEVMVPLPGGLSGTEERRLKVTKDTVIIQREETKEADKFQKEVTAYQAKLRKLKAGDLVPPPPSEYDEKAIVFSALKEKDRVMVLFAGDTATRIVRQAVLEPPSEVGT
jgi:hypothetical protein